VLELNAGIPTNKRIATDVVNCMGKIVLSVRHEDRREAILSTGLMTAMANAGCQAATVWARSKASTKAWSVAASRIDVWSKRVTGRLTKVVRPTVIYVESPIFKRVYEWKKPKIC
jgi:hypothetical protein